MKKFDMTCKENEILAMELYTGEHSYYAFGKDHKKMYLEIIKRYNSYAGTHYGLKTFADNEDLKGCPLFISKKKTDLFAFDDGETVDGSMNPVNYFDLIRKGV